MFEFFKRRLNRQTQTQYNSFGYYGYGTCSVCGAETWTAKRSPREPQFCIDCVYLAQPEGHNVEGPWLAWVFYTRRRNN